MIAIIVVDMQLGVFILNVWCGMQACVVRANRRGMDFGRRSGSDQSDDQVFEDGPDD